MVNWTRRSIIPRRPCIPHIYVSIGKGKEFDSVIYHSVHTNAYESAYEGQHLIWKNQDELRDSFTYLLELDKSVVSLLIETCTSFLIITTKRGGGEEEEGNKKRYRNEREEQNEFENRCYVFVSFDRGRETRGRK